jgi:hypothetical protein
VTDGVTCGGIVVGCGFWDRGCGSSQRVAASRVSRGALLCVGLRFTEAVKLHGSADWAMRRLVWGFLVLGSWFLVLGSWFLVFNEAQRTKHQERFLSRLILARMLRVAADGAVFSLQSSVMTFSERLVELRSQALLSAPQVSRVARQ